MDYQPAMPAESGMNELPAHAVLSTANLRWATGAEGNALLLHVARTMLVLESTEPDVVLPPLGTDVHIVCGEQSYGGRLAEHGRAGRFLVSLGERPVRGSLRLRVSLPAMLRDPGSGEAKEVEIVDLTTGGARIRGLELPVGSQVTLDFTPPGGTQPVAVRAVVAHGTHGAKQPWIGVRFRLVAIRGGR
jgi:hypothetical protein